MRDRYRPGTRPPRALSGWLYALVLGIGVAPGARAGLPVELPAEWPQEVRDAFLLQHGLGADDVDDRFRELHRIAEEAVQRGQRNRASAALADLDGFTIGRSPRPWWRRAREALAIRVRGMPALDDRDTRDRLRGRVEARSVGVRSVGVRSVGVRARPRRTRSARLLHRDRVDLARSEANLGNLGAADAALREALAASWTDGRPPTWDSDPTPHRAWEVIRIYQEYGEWERSLDALGQYSGWLESAYPDDVPAAVLRVRVLCRLAEARLAAGEEPLARDLYQQALDQGCGLVPGTAAFRSLDPGQQRLQGVWLWWSVEQARARLREIGDGAVPDGLDPTGAFAGFSLGPGEQPDEDDFGACRSR